MCSAKRHVRFTPNSGHVRRNSICPLSAKSGHTLSRERAYSGARALRNGISEIIIRPVNGSFSSKIK
jgi:hypothetical protein